MRRKPQKPIIEWYPKRFRASAEQNARARNDINVAPSSSITVNFPDDKSYTGALEAPNTIKWSNNSAWTKVVGLVTNPL